MDCVKGDERHADFHNVVLGHGLFCQHGTVTRPICWIGYPWCFVNGDLFKNMAPNNILAYFILTGDDSLGILLLSGIQVASIWMDCYCSFFLNIYSITIILLTLYKLFSTGNKICYSVCDIWFLSQSSLDINVCTTTSDRLANHVTIQSRY